MSKMFHAITFGPMDADATKYWNHITHHSTRRAAERWALDSLCIARTFGYVVIEEGEDYWEIVDESGAEKVSISCSRLGKFNVQPSTKLVIV